MKPNLFNDSTIQRCNGCPEGVHQHLELFPTKPRHAGHGDSAATQPADGTSTTLPARAPAHSRAGHSQNNEQRTTNNVQ